MSAPCRQPAAPPRNPAPGLPALGWRRRLSRIFWARLLVVSLLGNLSLPGLAQVWVDHNAGLGNEMIAVCTSAGIRMISVDQLPGAGFGDHDGAGGLPDTAKLSPGHCNACLANGTEGTNAQSNPPERLLTAWRPHDPTATIDPPARAPVMPGAQTRAPPVRPAQPILPA